MKFIQAILDEGGEVYEVGGSVRDSLLGRPIKDQDLLVRLINSSRLQKILKKFGHVKLVGKSFGVFKFVCEENQQSYDIALPRLEKSTGPGHRDFEIIQDPLLPLEEDLKRRDFTFNAIARNLQNQKLLDPFKGQQDLENKILRQVFDRSFVEDPLRMLRAIQFAARFELSVEENTLHSLSQEASLITSVSAERIVEELGKLMSCAQPSRGLKLMQETGLNTFLFPHLIKLESLFDKIIQRVDQATSLLARLTLLFTVSPSQIDFEAGIIWAQPLPLGILKIQQNDFSKLLNSPADLANTHLNSFELRKFLNHLGLNILPHWLQIHECFYPNSKLADQLNLILQEKPALYLKDLALQGKDLLKLGFEPGPKLGKILERLLLHVLEFPHHNEAEQLKKLIEIEKSTTHS